MKKTKGFMVWSLVLLLAGTSLLGCSKDDDGDAPSAVIEPPVYHVNDSIWKKFIVGHGWKHVVSYVVKNGKITNRKFYESMIGVGPHDLYFTGDSVTTYYYSDLLGGRYCKETKAYTTRLAADTKRYEIYREGEMEPMFSCDWLNNLQLCYYMSPFVSSKGTPLTIFTYMQRMSDKELKEWQKKTSSSSKK